MAGDASRQNGKKGGRPRKARPSAAAARSLKEARAKVRARLRKAGEEAARRPRSALTRREERFVGLLVSKPEMTQAQAYRDAGFGVKTDAAAFANAARLLRKDRVEAAVAAARARLRETFECTSEDIARELHRLGFANMADYIRVGANGDPYVDLSGLTREQAAAIAEVTVEDFLDGRGEDARDVRRVRFKLTDKRGALVDLAKLLGYFKEKHEHAHTFKPLTPEDLRGYSDEQIERALAGARALASVAGGGASA